LIPIRTIKIITESLELVNSVELSPMQKRDIGSLRCLSLNLMSIISPLLQALP
jgi:hypothetical protein